MNALDVSHGGDASDIVYGLALARRIADAHACRVTLYVPRDRPAHLAQGAAQVHGREFTMSEAAFDFLQPYLAMQAYVKEVLFLREAEIPPGAVRLDPHRFLQGLNVSAGNIADFAGKIYGISVDASEAWLQAHKRGEDSPRWPLTLGFSLRHRNASIDYSLLAHIDGVRFVGLPEEYEDFRNRYALPNLIHHRCATAVELAEAIGAARVFIGNQSLAFAIAEGLKVNRALESCELAPNVVPSGPGGGSFIYQSGLVSLLRKWGIELPEQAPRSAPPRYLSHLADVGVPDTSDSRACTERSPPCRPAKPAPLSIRIVCATRMGREAFFSDAALGKWLTLHRPADVELRLFPRNAAGLPSVYNTAITESANKDLILLFVHDDVHLCDFHWADRLREGLSTFDIVGLAGNRRRVPKQAGWVFLDERLTRDDRQNLSGMVGHGSAPSLGTIDEFGPSGQEVKLLDGLFLAAKSETLRAKALRFDERFDFHFYDLDLCRQAEQVGLRMGTWPISVVHQSTGSFRTDSWYRGYEKYLEKWKE